MHVKLDLQTHSSYDTRYIQYQNIFRDLAHSYRNVIVPFVVRMGGQLVCHIAGECRLRLLEYWVMRKVFGLKSDEVTEKWRRLHMEEFNVQYRSLLISG